MSFVALSLTIAAANASTAPEITAKNWYWGPGNRWSFKHTSRIFPSANIYRGAGPIANRLPIDPGRTPTRPPAAGV